MRSRSVKKNTHKTQTCNTTPPPPPPPTPPPSLSPSVLEIPRPRVVFNNGRDFVVKQFRSAWDSVSSDLSVGVSVVV